MARFDELKNEVIFDNNDLEQAWDHAPKLINKPANNFRLCYVCKVHMERKMFANDKNINNKLAWTIDMINAKKFDLEPTNLVAIHLACVKLITKKNSTRTLKKTHKMLWQFDEEFWKKKK
ncbi:hypothetical protein [Williamsoniiplasma luminosum]|uniref:Uncharacterized protein n=1 Tax=Williamsoniiplasma luminosum TaxID=214888 RepID=A0A2S0NJX9_9MOLU|nr:hypothetical protein [Williamsoniiplasma luminosum]AVP49311.1 MAG: hypothetical protein C5T88_01810 [Williamsoniiplasma luminosum]